MAPLVVIRLRAGDLPKRDCRCPGAVNVYTLSAVSDDHEPVVIRLPESVGHGVYANAASVWHTPYEFTLDFLVLTPVGPGEQPPAADVVARVKIPTQVIFQVAQAIAENVDNYEKLFGPLTPAPPPATRSTTTDEESTES